MPEPADHFVQTPGLGPEAQLYLRRKFGGQALGSPVLMVHGSTLPGSLAFDLLLDGRSWMDDLAEAGHDVWSLDIRGYGKSWKPPVSPRRDGTEEPVVRTGDAIADLSAAAAYVLDVTGAATLDLIGWSWGCTIVGAAISRGLGNIRRVVLHAPQWLRETPSAMVTPQVLNQSYRRVEAEAMQRRWFLGLPESQRSVVEQRGWHTAFRDALVAEGQEFTVPNGTIADIAQYWNAGRAYYCPSRIDVPVRIIVGDADVDTPPSQGQGLLARLPRGEIVILPHGTHFALIEPARDELFGATRDFLRPDPIQLGDH